MSIRIDGTNTAANPGITGADADTGLQFGTDEVNIVTGGTARATVDSSGRFLVGTSTARTAYTGLLTPRLQLEGTSSETSHLMVTRNENTATPSGLVLAKSRGTSTGSNVIVQNNDAVGVVGFEGSDGVDTVRLAEVAGYVDGTPGANDMPGRLVFSTTADGASSPTERVRITKEGYLRVHTIPAMYGDNFDWTSTTAKMHAGYIFYDTTSSWNNTTGVYTCPVDGKYLVSCDAQGHNVAVQSGASNQYANIVPFKNGVNYGVETVVTQKGDGTTTGNIAQHICMAFSLVIAASANDTIEVRSNHGFRSNFQNRLSIVYLG